MARALRKEESMNIVDQHMGVMREEKKWEIQELYLQLIFPWPRPRMGQCSMDDSLGGYLRDYVG